MAPGCGRVHPVSTMIHRGFRKVSPDDMRGVFVAGRRVSGKEARQGRYAKRRHWGSGRRPERKESSYGNFKQLQVVDWRPPVPSLSKVEPRSHFWGVLLGRIGVGVLGVMWLVTVLSLIGDGLGGGNELWGRLVLPSWLAGFLVCHLFGFVSDHLCRSRSPWGMRALVGYWISVLVWIPLGILFSVLDWWVL